jgi:molybdopterin-containing oxidoreductase family iron-sulfur binding subunit
MEVYQVTQYAMVIDLQKCVGCAACGIACKNENNVPDGIFWAHYIKETTGKFPNVKYQFIPTLCNHCKNAPGVAACPVTPKVMYKSENGATLHDVDRCIGCRRCEAACPYKVIPFNGEEAHQNW